MHELILLAVAAPRNDTRYFITVIGLEEKVIDIVTLFKQPGSDHFNYIRKSIHSSSSLVAVVIHRSSDTHTVASVTSIAFHSELDGCEKRWGKSSPFIPCCYAAVFLVINPGARGHDSSFAQFICNIHTSFQS